MKKNLIVISILIVLTILLLIVAIIIGSKRKGVTDTKYLVSYYSHGGYGLEYYEYLYPKYHVLNNKTIEVELNVKELNKRYDTKIKQPKNYVIKLSDNDYKNILNKVKKINIKTIKARSDSLVLDGSYQTYIFYTSDNKTKEVSGYMIRNHNLNAIGDEIFRSIPDDDLTKIREIEDSIVEEIDNHNNW